MANTDKTEMAIPEHEEELEAEELEAALAFEHVRAARAARKRRRILIGVIALVGVLGVVVWQLLTHSPQEEKSDEEPIIVTSSAVAGDFVTSFSAKGTTRALNSMVANSPVDGTIREVFVQEGSVVNQGDPLYVVNPRGQESEIQSARNALAEAQKAYDEANRSVDDAYKNYQQQWDEHNASGDWESFDEDGLNEAIRSAEEALANVNKTLTDAQNNVAKAEEAAQPKTIVAPMPGVVTEMHAVVDEPCNASSSTKWETDEKVLVLVSDLSKMRITVQVMETDVSKVREGQDAEVTYPALPGVLNNAVVEHIASNATGLTPDATPQRDQTIADETVTYSVNLIVNEPDPQLKPGMTANVSITTERIPDVLLVPPSALKSDDMGEWYVDVVDDEEAGVTRRAYVELLGSNSTESAVRGDLLEGELIALGDVGDVDDSGDLGVADDEDAWEDQGDV